MARDNIFADQPFGGNPPDKTQPAPPDRTTENSGSATVEAGSPRVRVRDVSRKAPDSKPSSTGTDARTPDAIPPVLQPRSTLPGQFSASAAFAPPEAEARMARVKNLSNQPLYLNLPGGRTAKIPPRTPIELPHSDLNSQVVLFHLSRGTLIVVGRDEF